MTKDEHDRLWQRAMNVIDRLKTKDPFFEKRQWETLTLEQKEEKRKAITAEATQDEREAMFRLILSQMPEDTQREFIAGELAKESLPVEYWPGFTDWYINNYL